MADIKELGKKIKAKYPGSYDDIDDGELGRKTKQKYPGSYDDFTDEPEPKSAAGFGGNILSSGANLVTGIAKAALSPWETAKAVAAIPAGAAQKNLRESAEANTGNQYPEGPQEPAWNATKKFYGDRYGSVDRALDTAYSDPVGTLADVSTVAGGVGGALKTLGQVPKLALAGQLGRAATTVSEWTNPVGVAGKAVGAVVPKGYLQSKARNVYQSALKPPPSWYKPEELSGMLDAGLDNNVFAGSSGAIPKVRGLIDDIDDRVSTGVADATASGATADPTKVVGEMSRSAERFKNRANPVDDLATLAGVEDEFLSSHGGVKKVRDKSGQLKSTPPIPIPVDKAQAIKRSTYQGLRDAAYGELKSSKVEGLKDIARGLKNEVYANLPPELAALGPKERSLIHLEETLERFANRQKNRDILGIGAPIAGGMVAAGTGDLASGALATFAKAAIEDPRVKSAIAIAMHKLAKRKGIPQADNIIKYGALGERASESQQPQ